MRKDILDFICSLHGYLIRLKEFHWSTDSNAEHLLCDEISDSISDLEDEFTETAMGYFGKKVGIGDLKPLLPNSESLKPMLKELYTECVEIKNKLKSPAEAGMCNILDELIAAAQKYSYRSTQK